MLAGRLLAAVVTMVYQFFHRHSYIM